MGKRIWKEIESLKERAAKQPQVLVDSTDLLDIIERLEKARRYCEELNKSLPHGANGDTPGDQKLSRAIEMLGLG